MKNIITTLFFATLLFSAGAQLPGVQLIGFKQSVARGAKPQTQIMEGSSAPIAPLTSSSSGGNLWLYLLHSKTTAITVTGIYINGKPYRAKATTIKQTPVIYSNEQIPGEAKHTTLVGKTSKTVLFIEPAGNLQNPTPLFKKAGAANEFAVRYTYKGKTYISSLKKIKEMSGAAAS